MPLLYEPIIRDSFYLTSIRKNIASAFVSQLLASNILGWPRMTSRSQYKGSRRDRAAAVARPPDTGSKAPGSRSGRWRRMSSRTAGRSARSDWARQRVRSRCRDSCGDRAAAVARPPESRVMSNETPGSRSRRRQRSSSRTAGSRTRSDGTLQ